MLVAGIQIQETRRRSATHPAAPITAPAISPPASAEPTEPTPSTARSASNPPIGKPRRIATGHAHGSCLTADSAGTAGAVVAVLITTFLIGPLRLPGLG